MEDATRRLGDCVGVALVCDGVANGAVTTPLTEPLPVDVETLKAMFLAQREALASAEARAMAAETSARDQALQIEKLEQQIARLRQERFGQSSERRVLLDQLELQLFELKEDKAQAEVATPPDETQAVQAFTRRKPARRPLPEHLPRERVVYPMPESCPCCGGALHKLGEDVTEMLELVPRQWKVIQLSRISHGRRVHRGLCV